MASPPALQWVRTVALALEKWSAVAPDGPARGLVFFENGLGLGQQPLVDRWKRLPAHGIENAGHSIERPEKIDRRGSGCRERVDGDPDVGDRIVGTLCFLRRDDYAIGRGNANSGCASYAKHFDRLGDGVDVAAVDVDEIFGQAGLVDEPEGALDPVNGCDRHSQAGWGRCSSVT